MMKPNLNSLLANTRDSVSILRLVRVQISETHNDQNNNYVNIIKKQITTAEKTVKLEEINRTISVNDETQRIPRQVHTTKTKQNI